MSAALLIAFIPLFAWGVGDFFIQRLTRQIGIWLTLFVVASVGSLLLFPFALPELPRLLAHPFYLWVLSLTSVFGCVNALINFEAFRRGKLSVISPLLGLELPITIGLSFWLRHEVLNPFQLILCAVIFIGVVLTGVQSTGPRRRFRLEKGFLLGLAAAVALGIANVTVGAASQDISPLVTVWFSHTAIALILLPVLLLWKPTRAAWNKGNLLLIASASLIDAAAWTGFAFATTLFPIGIAASISEGYIAVSALLGMKINRERLGRWQKLGIALLIGGILALSWISYGG